MTPEQFVAILTALAGVLGAVAVCIGEVRRYHHAVDGKMDELLSLTAAAALAQGKEEQRIGTLAAAAHGAQLLQSVVPEESAPLEVQPAVRSPERPDTAGLEEPRPKHRWR